ncbi:hypothetical protein T4E_10536 [Trichinella pseudospiralis]|uniref:Uncharacterized protein n=1 Tax=Trichinella pseudospiralis TaxID=6337 RepID=A0A0V0XRH3_TRIPS|nr:hypothetical protein T4E_10536 [Trichinella pseudospiralis]
MPSTTFTKVADGAQKQIELLHSDIYGPMRIATLSDHRYKEDNVNMEDIFWPQQEEPLDEGEPIKNTKAPTSRRF